MINQTSYNNKASVLRYQSFQFFIHDLRFHVFFNISDFYNLVLYRYTKNYYNLPNYLIVLPRIQDLSRHNMHFVAKRPVDTKISVKPSFVVTM